MSLVLIFTILAVLLIGIEMLILNFTVFWFLFFGLGAVVAALSCWLMPDLQVVGATGIFLLSSLFLALLAYPPLRKWQNKSSPLKGHDAINQRVKVKTAVSYTEPGTVVWSGSDWPAYGLNEQDSIGAGEMAVIKKVEGIHLFVVRN